MSDTSFHRDLIEENRNIDSILNDIIIQYEQSTDKKERFYIDQRIQMLQQKKQSNLIQIDEHCAHYWENTGHKTHVCRECDSLRHSSDIQLV